MLNFWTAEIGGIYNKDQKATNMDLLRRPQKRHA